MRILTKLQKTNENNPHLNYANIRVKAGEYAKLYSDKEIRNIIDLFVANSKVLLTVEYIAGYLKYQIEYTKYQKEIGHLGLRGIKTGSIPHYEDIGQNILN